MKNQDKKSAKLQFNKRTLRKLDLEQQRNIYGGNVEGTMTHHTSSTMLPTK